MVEILNGMSAKELTRRMIINHSILIKNLFSKINHKHGQFIRLAIKGREENDKLIKTNKRFDKAEWFDSRNEYDDRGKSLKKTKDQYDDYVALNDSELDKLTDEERNRLDNYRSSSMKLFEDFQKEWMDRESYESAAAKAPGLTSDYEGSI